MNKHKMILGLLVLFTSVSISSAELITIEAGDNLGSLSVTGDDELLMTGGWGDSISMSGNSLGNIYATDAGKQVVNLSAGSTSTLNIFGGTIGEIELGNSNLTTIKGGDIGTLISVQDVHGDAPDFAIIPRTHMYVSEYSYNGNTMLLTGKWQDLTSVSIQLEDKYGITTFDNLLFIPEPSSLVLLGLASLALRKRK